MTIEGQDEEELDEDGVSLRRSVGDYIISIDNPTIGNCVITFVSSDMSCIKDA